MRQITLAPLSEKELAAVAFYHGCGVDALRPMLTGSQTRCHEGRYYEQFAIRAGDCMVGLVSLHAQDGDVASEGVEVFPPFRRCGFAKHALFLLEHVACEAGFTVLTAQVRTTNTASLALHSACGYVSGEKWINRKGNEVITFHKELKTCITR